MTRYRVRFSAPTEVVVEIEADDEDTAADEAWEVVLRAKIQSYDTPAEEMLSQIADALSPPDCFGVKPTADRIIDTTTPSFCTWCGHLIHHLRCRGARDELCDCEHTPDDDHLAALDADDDLLARVGVLLALRWSPLWTPGDMVDVIQAVREASTYLERPDGACPDCGNVAVCPPICTTACRNDWPTTTEG